MYDSFGRTTGDANEDVLRFVPPLPFRILSTKLLLTFDTRDSSESAFSIQPEAVNLHLYQQTMVEAEVQ